MAFTESGIKTAKKQFAGRNKVIYGGTRLGLALHIGKAGATTWYLHYRIGGAAKKYRLGAYPWATIGDAQKLAIDTRAQIEAGIDPAAKKKSDKQQAEIDGVTFRSQAESWFADRYGSKAPRTIETIRSALDRDILPWLGDRPIAAIEAADLADCIERVQSRGANQAASRMKGYFSQIFKRAIRRRLVKHDIAADLESISLPEAKHVPAIVDPADFGGLIRAIRKYEGTHVVKYALELAPLVFLRPIELRYAKWKDCDFEDKTFKVYMSKMKREHIVPLSRQAIDILQAVHHLTGGGELVFASHKNPHKPIGKNTLNGALERLDFKGDMTSHGFRASASTLLKKLGFKSELTEKQLGHEKKDVEHAYNRYEFFDERRVLMQRWADYLDELATRGQVLMFPKDKAIL